MSALTQDADIPGSSSVSARIETIRRTSPRAASCGISEFPAVIGPMQQRLPLTLPAEKIARLAIHLQLTDVPADRGPALDLPCIFVPKPPAPIIAAIPLKPAARVFAVDPALAAPHRKRLAGRNPEEVHPGVGTFRGELCPREPTGRKLAPAIGQVFSAEDAEAQHFRRREVGAKVRFKITANRCNDNVPIALLHPVIHDDGSLLHRDSVPFLSANPECHSCDGPTKPRTNMAKNFQTCRILTNQGHVAQAFKTTGTIIRNAPGNSDLPALANRVVVQ